MSDDVLAEVAKIGGPAVLGAGGVGAFLRWIAGKEAQEVSTRLALMEQKLDQLVTSSLKHESNGERVAVLEQGFETLRDRMDAFVATPPRRRKGR